MDNLLHYLWKNAAEKPDNLSYRFLATGDITGAKVEISWSTLANKVKAIAATLQSQAQAGDRALLIYGPGLDFIIALYGCFAAGVIAVPCYPPDIDRLNRTLPRLQAITADAEANIVLTSSDLLAVAEPICAQTEGLQQLNWIATDQLTAKAQDWMQYCPKPEDIAYLQYTSGSTGDPKGVMVSHSNLVYTCMDMIEQWPYSSENCHQVSWLPTFHDLGLIWGLMTPLMAGIPCTFMSPMAFLQRPARWFEAISHYRATTSAAPNFAYDLCVRKIDQDVLNKLDLSSLQAVMNAAEPVRATTIADFCNSFEAVGFRAEMMCPWYGLAEATLQVSVSSPEDGIAKVVTFSSKALENNQAIVVDSGIEDAVAIVGCGKKSNQINIAIVDPETKEAKTDGEIGEIWVSGPIVAKGYWNRPEISEEIFRANILQQTGNWLRTGDLGFLYNGELFITGRHKDLIIIRGRNIYPQDIERRIEQESAAIRPGCVAAFAMEKDGVEETIGIVAEIEMKNFGESNLEDLLSSIRLAILNEFEVNISAIMLIERGSIHKTSSGKIQRKACRNSLMKQTFPQIAFWTMEAHLNNLANSNSDSNSFLTTTLNRDNTKSIKKKLEGISEKRRFSTFLTFVSIEIVTILSLPSVSLLPVDIPLKELGLDSLKAVEVRNSLSTMVQRELPSSLLFDYPTTESLAKYLFNIYLYPATTFDSSMYSDEQIKEIISEIPITLLRQSPLLEPLIKLSQSSLVTKNNAKNDQNKDKQKDQWLDMDTQEILRNFGIPK